ncbi:unnamed protein product [Dibothriocephalus latus]|uniref:Uncharacterized protein n=1 Tax=Dibothriocephalus latus TaxID=60516 RepID=A0A3P7LYV8_DIBLA|nr:unnamed protein product [Dibothriocephalus latus]
MITAVTGTNTFEVKLVTKKDSSTPVNEVLPMSFKNIAWPSDRDKKFGKPTSWVGTIKPDSWPKPAYEYSPDAYRGFSQLLVWMRIAALPNFRKNYADVPAEGVFSEGLPAGNYTLRVNYCKWKFGNC